MNRDTIRQVAVIVATVVTIGINILANALPINGLNTGQISDSFDVYFVPAGYVFAIWGLIYIGWIAYAIYQALPAQRENPRLRSIGWWYVLGAVANSVWIFLWHYQVFALTVVAMVTLLVSLIVVYLRLGTGRTQVSRGETWAVRVPFSIYLGWITVATIANVTDLLYYLGWNGFGISELAWFLIMLIVALAVATLMALTRSDVAYLLVLVWSFAGIGVKFAGTPVVAPAAWVATAVVLGLVLLSIARRPALHRGPAAGAS